MARPAPAGNVTTHDMKISRTTRGFKLASPRAIPTPITAPTSVCVVEIGMPSLEAMTIVVAAANSAEKPRVGVSSVILRPMVSMTRQPQVAKPTTMPAPPKPRIQNGKDKHRRQFFCTLDRIRHINYGATNYREYNESNRLAHERRYNPAHDDCTNLSPINTSGSSGDDTESYYRAYDRMGGGDRPSEIGSNL